jgi:hypothetical protein
MAPDRESEIRVLQAKIGEITMNRFMIEFEEPLTPYL